MNRFARALEIQTTKSVADIAAALVAAAQEANDEGKSLIAIYSDPAVVVMAMRLNQLVTPAIGYAAAFDECLQMRSVPPGAVMGKDQRYHRHVTDEL